jgi:D-arabinose 1-dehydrogenase-like Zn-dependent alcohol dehydrogenase
MSDSVTSASADPAGRTARGPAEMTAMVLRTDRSIGLERWPAPTPRDDQVLVEVDLCGICGSDLHSPQTPEVYLGGFVLGHEPANVSASTRTATRAGCARRVARGV